MAGSPLTAVLRQVRKLAGLPPEGRSTDAELLERFTSSDDPAAFAALIARYGPLVWRVCRRVLGHDHDAEDAFQATFLALVRGAGTIRNPAVLAGWLHGVAFRLAEKARAAADRRRAREHSATHGQVATPCQEAAWRELGRLIEEAVHALPERYRAPILLCYWEGLTNEEAARRLGWATGTLKARLARARQLLHGRLTARGVTLPVGVVALLLSPGGEWAQAVPPSLGAATAGAILAGARGEVGGVSASAVALAGEALPRAGLSWLKRAVVVLLVLGAVGLGADSLTRTPHDEPTARPRQDAKNVEDRGSRIEDRGSKEELLSPSSILDPRSSIPRAGPRKDLYGDALPPGAVARLGSVRLRHGYVIDGVAFAPDSKAVATLGRDGFACVWDLATGKEVGRFRPPRSGVHALAHVAGRAVALARSDDGFRLWDVSTGRPAGELMRAGKADAGDTVTALSPGGKLAVTAGRDGTARVWDAATGKELRRVTTGHARGVRAVQLSPDGRILASVGDRAGDSIRLHDVRTGALLHEFVREEVPSGSLTFSPDGKWIAGVSRGRHLLVWDIVTGKVARRLEPPPRERVESVTFTADGKTLISGGEQVRFWDAGTGKMVRQLSPPPRSGAYVALAPDGRTLATWGECALVLWDLTTGREQPRGGGHRAPVHALAVSPDGRLVATACFGDSARLWDVATGRELRQFAGDKLEGSGGVAFSPDGRLLATSDAVRAVRLWRLDTGAEVRRLKVERPMDVAFSPDGKMLLTAGWDYVVRLWDPATGKELRQLNLAELRGGPGGGYNLGVAFSPDGQLLATADTSVILWRADSGKLWRRLTEPERQSEGGPVAFSPDGRLVAARGSEKDTGGVVRLWEAVSGKEIATLRGIRLGSFSSIAFSSDGRTVAAGGIADDSGGVAGRLILWDLASGKELAAPEGHQGWLTSVVFTPDGRRLVTGASDTTALVWDVPALTRRARPEAVRLAPGELDGLWSDLTGTDAARAWRAVWRLAADPEQALPLLRRHLRPAPTPDAGQVARLLADLGSERFEKRDRAARELEAVGEAAAPLLRRALETRPSLETRRRIEQILERWEGPTAARRLAVRATAVLEQAGTEEARRLLEQLAGGAADAYQTREARASRERLARRATAAP